jgi:hypothetical protein
MFPSMKKRLGQNTIACKKAAKSAFHMLEDLIKK